jgi:hypothetical protein
MSIALVFFYFSFDLKTLPLELVDILRRMIPNEKEIKAFKEYEKERKPINMLADEDQFVFMVIMTLSMV